jgi:5'(3')-deoxyribonucleotidase
MRFVDIKENGGRVVKGVNTTPDVGVDAIKKQAAKFGNKVDKDGRPPTLSKKVKGSKTNVLFNLGMSESVEEGSLSKGEEKKKEKYVKGMKKSKGDFKDRYGKDAEAVMYATATKMAKEGQVHELQADELSEASEIYIDMDGVLVDFFGEWTKMQGVKDWKQIKNVGKALQDIRDTEDFWLKLKPTPNADKLHGLVKEIRGEYNILSAPLADDPRAEPHKREWIEKNLTAFPPKKVIITTDKAKYATSTGGTPNILIDDFGQNVAKWEAAGGVGIKHKLPKL